MTYDLIQEQVLGSAAASVTFSNIPGTFKDLVLEVVGVFASNDWFTIQFNSDTGNNYSVTTLQGNSSNIAISQAQSGVARITLNGFQDMAGTSVPSTALVSVFSYANTNVNKTVLCRSSAWTNSTTAAVGSAVGLWRSTSAITGLSVRTFNGSNYGSNSIFRLWGVV